MFEGEQDEIPAALSSRCSRWTASGMTPLADPVKGSKVRRDYISHVCSFHRIHGQAFLWSHNFTLFDPMGSHSMATTLGLGFCCLLL